MSLNSQIFQNSGVWRCPLDVTRILVVAAGGGACQATAAPAT